MICELFLHIVFIFLLLLHNYYYFTKYKKSRKEKVYGVYWLPPKYS